MIPFSAILPNLIGFTISSCNLRLRLQKILGNGAYGVVYLAHDLSTPPVDPHYYAVKVLLKHPKGSELAFIQEREIAYQKSVSHHPHVVKLHEVIEEEYYIYLVMDYYSGGDLYGAIAERRAFVNNDEQIRRIFLQILDAVHCCHDTGVYHRDLKPENIMCSGDGSHVYVGDFGLASKVKLSTAFGHGSSFYMSPGMYRPNQPIVHGSPTS